MDLFDPASVRAAVEGCQRVVHMATHIPPLTKGWKGDAWATNDRLRREGTRILADASRDAGVEVLVKETVSFFYADGGDRWIDEDWPIERQPFSDASLDAEDTRGARAFVTALQVRLTAEHYGLPAGTEVMVGYAESEAKVNVEAKPEVDRKRAAKPPKRKAKSKKPVKGVGVGPEKPSFTIRPPPDVTPRLTAGGYVFPVYGPCSFGDTFGAPRGDIASGWHHGEDIFGQLGTPLLAVADGTIFSAGWNDIGGYRLWLRDRDGNEFYYAHLSAFSPFAVNGRQVKAGTVIGFMGNSGDAQTTPYHLHFEIHPVGMLYLGYDGAVRAYPYLTAWRRLEDVDFAKVAGWAPPISPTSSAPKPGAILLSSSDISTADGLDPGSLERALKRANKEAG